MGARRGDGEGGEWEACCWMHGGTGRWYAVVAKVGARRDGSAGMEGMLTGNVSEGLPFMRLFRAGS